MELINKIMKKLLTKEVITYVIFGVLTTAVNFCSFFVMNSILKWEENISNLIAIILSILFAYFTNKKWVFNSKTENLKESLKEFSKFISGRGFTMLIEFFGGVILFKLPIAPIISKFGLSIIVVILNFFISKFFAFNN